VAIAKATSGDAGAVAPAAQRAYSPPELGTLAVVTAVAALLRFHALAEKSFWFDEGVSVAIARLDWYNFARILWRREANMSLYYFLLHFWLRFGHSEFFIRSLSVLFATASIPAIYLLGRRLIGARVGLLAASLLAVNAYHVQYSQEARSYSLMTLLCVLSSLYFLKCLSEPSRRNRTLYVVVTALAVYAQFFAALLVLAQWLSLSRLDHDSVSSLKTDLRWIVLAISPILIFVATTGAGPLRWVQRPTLKDLWYFAFHLAGNGGVLLLGAIVVLSIVALLPLWRQRRLRKLSRDAWPYWLLLLWIVVPPLLTLGVSLVKPLFVPRYFIFCLPALLLLVACGVTRLRFQWLTMPAISFLLILSFGGTADGYRRDLDIEHDDWRSITQYLLSHAQPGDALLFHVPMGRMPYEFYHSLQPQVLSPAIIYPHHADHITFLDFVEKPNDAELARLIPLHRRVWLVLTYAKTTSGQPDDRTAELTHLLGQSYRNIGQHDTSGVSMLLYSVNSQ
jgi:mannosyltransferase